jgi:pimeloyl-ACP methyl ester carboxylesterase
MNRLLFCLICLVVFTGEVKAQYHPADHVYQYSIKVGSRNVYLWIPPKCKQVNGVIISMANLMERNWLEDPLVRHIASRNSLGIIWIGPATKGDTILTADMTLSMKPVFEKMMSDLAVESGYAELKSAPVIPMGHSANGHFSWTFANAFPERTIAAIAVKTIPFPTNFKFKDLPVCYVVGETTEWPQFRVPDPATQPGDRDFYWPVVRESALALRKQSEENLVGVVTDPGGGHFDWSAKLARFISLYIDKACYYRLPHRAGDPLRPVNKESGWLTGTGGMNKDDHAPAPYLIYSGSRDSSYWFFDKKTAKAAVAFEGDRVKRKKQMLSFIQDGKLLAVAKSGYAALKFEPENDGISFKLKGGFLPVVPAELIDRGTSLGHGSGVIKFRIITGPAIQTGPADFRLQADRTGIGGDIWIQEEHDGDADYRHAVQPGMMHIPARLIIGAQQLLKFKKIDNVVEGKQAISLQASATSGLPVQFYIKAGPAYIDNDRLVFTDVPRQSRMPVKVTVVAYQWGKTTAPACQSAALVEQVFYIIDKLK